MASQPLFGGYASQVSPQRTATALPTATPEDYGAGIGEALSGAGQVAGNIAIRQAKLEAEREYDRQLMAAQLDMSRRQADFDIRKNEDRQSGERPGAQGHTAAMTQWLDKAGEEFLGSIQHEGLRQKFAARWGEWRANRIVDADAFERVSGARLAIEQDKAQEEIMGNRAATMNPAEFQELLQEIATDEKPSAVSGDVWMARRREKAKTVSVSYLGGLPPDVRLATLDSGLFDTILSPDEKDQLRRGGKIELKAAQIEAEEAAKDARVAARNEVELLEARVEAGDIPSAKEVAATLDRARAAGVPEADLKRFSTKYEDGLGMVPYSAGRDPTGARAVRELARIDALDAAGKARPEDLRRAEKLRPIAKERARERGQALKDVAARGPAGQIEALNQIAQLPTAEQRFVAAQELGDGLNLGHISLLSANARTLAINGREVRKARPKDFGDKDMVTQRFRRLVGSAGPALGGDYGALQDLAWDIYTGMRNARGDDGWDRATFDVAVRVAFGATKRSDGRLQGGLGEVRGRPVILPDDRTADEFDAILSRLTFKDGVYADGSPASKADVLARFRPEFVGVDPDGHARYRMIGPDERPLRMKDGRVFPIRIPPRRAR